MSVDASEISVVIQGPVLEEASFTLRALKSVRRILPEAELILSTWDGANVENLEYDHLVLSKDPGVIATLAPKAGNLNRLLLSTQAGLAATHRPYCLKLRTDLLLTGKNLAEVFGCYREFLSEHRVFESRVATWNAVTVSADRDPSRPYHPSDICHFGRTEDLRRLWNVPLYSIDAERLKDPIYPGQWPVWTWTSEQYLWIHALQKHTGCSLPPHGSEEELKMSQASLLNNFVVLDQENSGLQWRGGIFLTRQAWAATLGHAEWRELYRRKILKKMARPVPSVWKKKAICAMRSQSWIIRGYQAVYYWLVPNGRGKTPVPVFEAVKQRLLGRK
jgi:hypothetical protein